MNNQNNNRTTSNVYDRFRQFIMTNVSKIAAVTISLIYILTGCFKIVKKEFDPFDFAGDLGTSLLVGLSLYVTFRASGISDGRRNILYVESYNLYAGKKADVAKTKKYMLPAYCVYKNKQELEEAKINYLEQVGLSYASYKKGQYKEGGRIYEVLEEEQKQALMEVEKIKIKPITTKFLLSDAPLLKAKHVNNSFGRETKDYMASGLFKDAVTMLMISGVSAAYILEPIINGEMWSSILWHIFQVIMWLVFGIIKYCNAVEFMVHEYRQTHIIYKAELLEEFLAILRDNEAILYPFDYIGIALKEEEESKNNTEVINNEQK